MHAHGGEVFKPLETASLKTIAAFLNSQAGGTLRIGVADDSTVFELDSNHASLAKEGKDNADLFQLHRAQIVQTSMGDTATANVFTQIHTIDGKDLCRVHIKPSAFYVRLNNETREITDADEKQKYIAQRWGTA
jgi:type I restriction enzyme R subunit